MSRVVNVKSRKYSSNANFSGTTGTWAEKGGNGEGSLDLCVRDWQLVLDSEGEGGMIWENDILTCILSCELNRQSMSDAGCSMLGAGAWG